MIRDLLFFDQCGVFTLLFYLLLFILIWCSVTKYKANFFFISIILLFFFYIFFFYIFITLLITFISLFLVPTCSGNVFSLCFFLYIYFTN